MQREVVIKVKTLLYNLGSKNIEPLPSFVLKGSVLVIQMHMKCLSDFFQPSLICIQLGRQMRGENTKQRKHLRQDLEIPGGKMLWAIFRHSDSCLSIKSKSTENSFSEFLKVIHITIYKLENHKLNSENNLNYT